MPEHSGDAVVVGAGPNGLAAAIVLAQAGRRVTLIEGAETVGGGCRSEELTLPGFVHDTCSTVHALALASPFLSSLPLAQHGLELVHPEAPLAHPLDDGTAVVLERSVEETAQGLGPDAQAYRRLFDPLVRNADQLMREILGPLRPPRHPLVLARFGVERAPLGDRAGALRASRASGRAPCWRVLRAFDALVAHPGQRRLRNRARAERAPGRLARRPRRLAAPGRRARRASAFSRRRDPHG